MKNYQYILSCSDDEILSEIEDIRYLYNLKKVMIDFPIMKRFQDVMTSYQEKHRYFND